MSRYSYEGRRPGTKKPVLLIFLALIVGFALGLFFNYGFLSPGRTTAMAVNSTVVDTGGDLSTGLVELSLPPLDTGDDAALLERADAVLISLKDEDYAALSALVHPVKGITFTPYSTVDFSCDQMLTAQQIAALDQDETVYTWGVLDGKGTPIQMTGKEYFQRYVFNADYTQAPQVGVDKVLSTGNAMENVRDSYPDGRFVEYHFPGLDDRREGYDWCSLKLVFEPYQCGWYLVGLIHSEWTI